MSAFQNIDRFEPGEIDCTACGFKPEDAWSMDPDGFVLSPEKEWFCEECLPKEESVPVIKVLILSILLLICTACGRQELPASGNYYNACGSYRGVVDTGHCWVKK